MLRRYATFLVLLVIATMLSLGIWLYTAGVVLAPQIHRATHCVVNPVSKVQSCSP